MDDTNVQNVNKPIYKQRKSSHGRTSMLCSTHENFIHFKWENRPQFNVKGLNSRAPRIFFSTRAPDASGGSTVQSGCTNILKIVNIRSVTANDWYFRCFCFGLFMQTHTHTCAYTHASTHISFDLNAILRWHPRAFLLMFFFFWNSAHLLLSCCLRRSCSSLHPIEMHE